MLAPSFESLKAYHAVHFFPLLTPFLALGLCLFPAMCAVVMAIGVVFAEVQELRSRSFLYKIARSSRLLS